MKIEWMNSLQEWLESEPPKNEAVHEVERDWGKLREALKTNRCQSADSFIEETAKYFDFCFQLERKNNVLRVLRGFHANRSHVFSPPALVQRSLELEPARVLRLPANRVFDFFALEPKGDVSKLNGFLFSLSGYEGFVGLSMLAEPWLQAHVQTCLNACQEFMYLRRENEEQRRLLRFKAQLSR